MGPGVIGHLDLPGVDHRPQRRPVFGPRCIGAVDEECQPGAGIAAELRERGDHGAAGAVIDGQRQLLPSPGSRVNTPTGAATRA